MIAVRERVHGLWNTVRTIRMRLTLWYVALLVVILVAVGTFLYISLTRTLRADADRILESEARQVVASLDIEDGRSQLGEAAPSGAVVALYNNTGEILVVSDPRQPLPLLTNVLTRAVQGQRTLSTARLAGDEDWRILTLPVVENGRVVAVLQVARSDHEVQAALSRLLMLMAGAVPLTLIVAVGGGLFLAGRALGPIDRITRAVRRISADDLSQRLTLPPRDDEVGRLAATFDQMLERLDQAFQRQRRFTADASHELRTPLALLMTQADVVLDRPRRASEYREALAAVRDDAARMSRLVNELLTLARADAGQEVLAREPVALDELVSDTVAAMTPLAERHQVRLEQGAAASAVVDGDQTRLTQLLANLVDNGIKYTPSGGRVTLSVGRDGGWAVLQVTDTGIGIAAEHLPHVFDRFYRVDPARTRAAGGTGLGLSICRWVVEAHGGTISIASAPDRGTTVTARLPLARPGLAVDGARAPITDQHGAERPPTGTAPDRQRARVDQPR